MKKMPQPILFTVLNEFSCHIYIIWHYRNCQCWLVHFLNCTCQAFNRAPIAQVILIALFFPVHKNYFINGKKLAVFLFVNIFNGFCNQINYMCKCDGMSLPTWKCEWFRWFRHKNKVLAAAKNKKKIKKKLHTI